MTKLIQTVVDTIQILIDNAEQGFGASPEVDFVSMRSADNLNQADPKIYEKTGKMISLQREIQPLKLIIFLDININIAKDGLLALLDQIISYFSGEILLEIRNGDNEVMNDDRKQKIAGYKREEYETSILDIVEYAHRQTQEGNVVVVVSDRLGSEQDMILDSIVCIQIQLPILSSDYHPYYIRPFEVPESDYWFVA